MNEPEIGSNELEIGSSVVGYTNRPDPGEVAKSPSSEPFPDRGVARDDYLSPEKREFLENMKKVLDGKPKRVIDYSKYDF